MPRVPLSLSSSSSPLRPLRTRIVCRGSGSRAPPPLSMAMAGGRRLEELEVDSSFLRELPGEDADGVEGGGGTRQVFGAFWSKVLTTPTKGEDPSLLAFSSRTASKLGLAHSEADRADFPAFFCGDAPLPLPAATPFAQNYGGHQFGHWAGQLGDGRAISLVEIRTEEGGRWELQLKGAGPTPYSRRADGRAVLRSSVREYVASEAMEALGIPTTHALSLVGTGDKVIRDMFYNGNVQFEPGAVVCRVAPSFVRFGTFQLPALRGKAEHGLVKQLADYVLSHHYPHLTENGKRKYADFYHELAHRTAVMVARWQCVGFVHGVLNTDNMSILGLTIDYGPFGFMEVYEPQFTPNITDFEGRRYCYGNQPQAGLWNIAQLGHALELAGLITEEELEEGMVLYRRELRESYTSMMARKMGLRELDETLHEALMKLMAQDEADFTMTWRSLGAVAEMESTSGFSADGALDLLVAAGALAGDLEDERKAEWKTWIRQYGVALAEGGLEIGGRRAAMDSINPLYIPRNYLLQEAIDAAEKNDLEPLNALLRVLSNPYVEHPNSEKLTKPAPAWALRKAGIAVLS